ncbi:MAG: molybdenum cofactor guanylyltransferase [Candidatus Zhuqueibacterota bacterium]
MTGIILAGGKNSRISMTKAFIQLGEQTIIERTVDICKTLFNEVIIVTNHFDDYLYLGTKLVQDAIPNTGPLGGLYSGLMASTNLYNFVVACDMPFINPAIIRHLQLYTQDEHYDVILPEYNGFTEPLFAFYSKNCINTIEVFLNQNRLKIRTFFTNIKVKEVKCDKFSAIEKSFFNINTREDLQLARNLICG